MSDFYKTTLGVESMTREDLDFCARERRGVVGSIGYGYACPGTLPDQVHDYGCRWIDTRGMGNHGTLVLVARSPRAAEMLRAGRVRGLEQDYGLSHGDALRLEYAQRGVKYGREERVVRAVLANRDVPRAAWESCPGVGGGMWRWVERWGIAAGDCTAYRLEAVAAIMRRLSRGGFVC